MLFADSKKILWEDLKTKLWVFWKQIKHRIILNQHVLKMWITVKIINTVEEKEIRNYFEQKEKQKDCY